MVKYLSLFIQAPPDRLYFSDENNKESGYRMFVEELKEPNDQPTHQIN
jgi:hypothetical protein